AIYWSLIVARVILNPPDADPVMPASVVVVTASLTSGSRKTFPSPLLTVLNAGKEAITAPNPYSEAVLSVASNAPPTDRFKPAVRLFFILPNENKITTRIPMINPPDTAQIADKAETSRDLTPSIPIWEKSIWSE